MRTLFFITILFCAIIFCGAFAADGQTGVLLPLPSAKPDESVLAVDSVDIRLCVDNQTVKARVVQVFANKTANALEGKFVFALPESASVADFAVWDGTTRIPGVMLEKRRANQIYGEIKRAVSDPGILQTDEDASGRANFSARVFPIPAFGTKRIELEYQQNLPIVNFKSRLAFPLGPSFGSPQTIRRFSLSVCAASDIPLAELIYDSDRFPLNETVRNETEFNGSFAAENYLPQSDFVLDITYRSANSILSFITYRAPEIITAYDLRNPRTAKQNADGFFEMRALFNEPADSERQPRRIVIAVDTSLSMYGEKLRRAVESAEYILGSLGDNDEFNLALFADEMRYLSPEPLNATAENTAAARDFLRNSTLGGGTNMRAAFASLAAAAARMSGAEKHIFLISDASATRETVDLKKNLKPLEGLDSSLRFSGLTIGTDAPANLFFQMAKRTGGMSFGIRETEDAAGPTGQWLATVGAERFGQFMFSSSEPMNFYDVYPTAEQSFNGSSVSFVGRYREPKSASVTLQSTFGARNPVFARTVELPVFADVHNHLPRLWARARIDALVREMDLNGEDADLIEEIIALSQKFKLVSPYTAFIAAPRALLRPRLIQPGDPVIRVKTDASVKSVVAVLPFGETLSLSFIEADDVWETRFLAPVWMNDGAYNCRLLLSDADGNAYEEVKTFVVDSRAPTVTIVLDKNEFHSGESAAVRVSSDRDTIRLFARIGSAKPVRLFWSDAEKANIGRLPIPPDVAPGKYLLTVTAEDAAHNQTTETITIGILGG